LVEAFAGAALTTHGLNYKIACGQEVLPAELSQCVSTMVRVAQRLGLQRRSKDVTPSLSDLLRGGNGSANVDPRTIDTRSRWCDPQSNRVRAVAAQKL
jgi:hypothetical protein